jgi:pimeloyl-ACP methyl ester carboxylesterase
MAKTIEAFVDALKLKRYAMYVFDYGAPVGLRLAVAHPERVTALISQNGNAYLDGLGDAWDPIRKYWQNPSQENRDALRGDLNLQGIRWQYEHGVPEERLALIAPESYTLAAQFVATPGNVEIQLDLSLDYANNLTAYPAFQQWFRKSQVPTLVIWGKNDPFFIPPGAEAFKRDNANAVVEFVDSGHFALETHTQHIAQRIVAVLGHAIV